MSLKSSSASQVSSKPKEELEGKIILKSKLDNNFIQLTEVMIESQPVDKSLKWRIRLAKIYILGNSIGLLLSLVLFVTGYLDWLWFSRQIMASIGGSKIPVGPIGDAFSYSLLAQDQSWGAYLVLQF